jgi:predicted thioesterase
LSIDLLVGTRGRAEMAVTEKDTALQMGSGGVNVLSTPTMIALMEKAAQTSVQPFMTEGYVTVGIEINIKHLRATPVGMRVTAESVLTRVEGKQLDFQVTARDEKGVVGSGTHARAIVEYNRFMEKVNYS